MKHRLFIIEDGAKIKREELINHLESIPLDIPIVQPLVYFPAPIKPDVTVPYVIYDEDGHIQINPIWAAWDAARIKCKQDNAIEKSRFIAEMDQVIAYLQSVFTGIETYVKTGQTNQDGTSIWEWQTFNPPKYGFSQCATVLSKPTRPEDVIGFIAFGYFGS